MNCQKDLFQLPDDEAYLNCAYMSPQLRTVEATGHAMVSMKNQPYLLHPEDFFSTVRSLKEKFARLVNVPQPERIALTPSASYGLANVANNISLEKGQEVLVAGDQFPSNYYPWQRIAADAGANIVSVPAPDAENRTAAWNAALLEAIGEQTALVALGHTHWTDGTVFDLKAIRARSREVGALLVIDGTQSVGALPFDVAEYQPDALICAGYKWLLGPYATGLAYYGPRFDNGVPIEENWINRLESEDFKNLVQYQGEYQPLAGRYSVGEQSNFILVPMLDRALDQLLDWGIANIQEYTKSLSAAPLAKLRDMGCRIEDEAQRSGHLFGLRPGTNFDSNVLANQLQNNRVYVSVRGDAIRVAPHVYNDDSDFERLLSCFATARKTKVH